MQTGSSETLIGWKSEEKKTIFSLYGTEWRERGYGLGGRRHEDSELNATKYSYDCFLFFKSKQCSSPQ
jgi:hypothetical protein